MTKRFALKTSLLIIIGSLATGGCALFEGKEEAPFLPKTLTKPTKENTSANSSGPKTASLTPGERSTGYFQTPRPPAATRNSTGTPPAPPLPVQDEVTTAVNLENMPIPQFANAVFGTILKRNVSIDPQVQQRTDLISLRTGKPQSADQLFRAAQAVLRSYGVAVNEFQGLIRIVPDKAEVGYLPEIRRGRAQPDTPASIRPVFYLAELEHTNIAQASSWLRSLFPNRLTVQDDSLRNSLMLSGQSDTVSAAMEALQILDQPLLRGRHSVRVTPVFWSADELAKRLVDLLMAEGYSASLTPSSQTPILVVPIAAVNSIVLFSANEQVLNHALRWAQELDQTPPSKSGNYVNYQVRNSNAADLAKTLQEIIGGGTVTTSAPSTTGVASASPANSGSKKVVVNPASNSLIIQTSPTEYQQWYGLLRELDRPARSAMIMATVAEVRLTDSEQLGFQWLLNQFKLNGGLINIGSTSSIAAPSTGPRISIANLSGDPRALLNFLASSNKIRILSNPSIVARNGETATIQVGQEVPILTSQISNANTGTATGQGVLQTVQYRTTGVILKVKPVIHSTGRMDIDVTQEVSAAQVNETGVNNSPLFLTRKVDTKLTVTDGNTVLLGGLIQENRTAGHAGIPLLKDIPIAGALFRTSASVTEERTELVVLLTPYVLEDDFDANAITTAFRSQFSWATQLPQIPLPAKGENDLQKLPKDDGQGDSVSPQSTYRSQPYVIKDSGAPTQVSPINDSISSQPSAEQASDTSKKFPTAPVTTTKLPAQPESPPGTRPITDENLRRELLNLIK